MEVSKLTLRVRDEQSRVVLGLLPALRSALPADKVLKRGGIRTPDLRRAKVDS